MHSHTHETHSPDVINAYHTGPYGPARGRRIESSSSWIDSQLASLRARIEELLEAASADNTSVGARIRPLLDELLIKQEAICWKIRVAKRFHGDAYEALMADIFESTDRLRIAIDLVARAYSDVLQVI